MNTYTICLIGLERQPAVVVGGGAVAARKARGLLEAGARVLVISPQLSPDLEQLVSDGEASAISRTYQPGDLEALQLKAPAVIIAATDDSAVNQQVWQESERLGHLINVVDDPQHSNFIMPAVVRRGDVTLAVSTGGSSPALARRLREKLEAYFGPEYGELAAVMAELRPDLLANFDPGAPRRDVALQLIDSDLLEVLRKRGREAARRRASELLAEYLDDGI